MSSGRKCMVDQAGLRPGNARSATADCAQCNPFDEAVCAPAKKEIHNKCGVDSGENKKFRNATIQRNKARAKPTKKRGPKPPYVVRNKTWKDKHCEGPLLFNFLETEFKKRLESMKDDAQELLDDFKDLLDQIDDMVGDVAWEAAKNRAAAIAAANAAAAMRLCKFGGGWGAIACLVVSAGYTAYKVHDAYAEAKKALMAADLREFERIKAQVADTIKNSDDILKAMEADARALELNPDMEKEDQGKEFKKVVSGLATAMEAKVKASPCLMARRCYLMPHTSKGEQGSINRDRVPTSGGKEDMATSIGLDDPRGCCPGQTGHHLVLDAWIRPEGVTRSEAMRNKKLYLCGEYNPAEAPTVCVEGISQNMGSHKTVHNEATELLQRHIDEGNTFDMDAAIKIGAESNEVLNDKCPDGCVEAQLRDYYSKLRCKPLRPVDANGKSIEPSPSSSPTTPPLPGEGESFVGS